MSDGGVPKHQVGFYEFNWDNDGNQLVNHCLPSFFWTILHILETIERLQSLLLRSYAFRVYHNVIQPNPMLLVHHNIKEYHH